MSQTRVEAFLLALCETIQRCRCVLGLSEDELADKIHQTPSFVRNLERGRIDFSIRTLVECANAFDVTVAELMELADIGSQPVVLCDEESTRIDR